MFSILTTLIGVLLIAAITFLTTYYMGDTVFGAQEEAKAAAIINSATQIHAAVSIYKFDHRGQSPETVQALVDKNYIATVPPGKWHFGNSVLLRDGSRKKICQEVNRKLHDDPTIPSCGATNVGFIGCCSK